ncbi:MULTISPECIES: LacI family DNA-binding transcriptional regulator [unclassified Rhizobium]|uniref:LacI family DNA-binding transcriptional regulator n=1 Tax=unclassified Rhizobium TaxID=2613769 RepID=UPI0011606E5E|nr:MULTISPECIES: LacI family DNA-binding transcriptional regulator [unclassified Rhizobium]MBO9101566.1 LacI family DNA-binding transcriptional regulator [Rhizobium sp. L58/93]MBO9187559.1 LacI family DNA-binding transcriptional regulator [Rhizobium sp. E27B/91]MBZ5761324.1 LacI family DNA-binding transcriptional regulator [Rhizobium sp. VS19-DR96]MBZ5767078.1 LacI family DNA-binding transcriptional regulator [Rhizobium sp. VS19-DR129.2]MBZ5774963.1 LacI family DNA-binding transcriptional regu
MVTIKEIANAVGVSSATVSRVLNYDATLSISASKRQAVIETAEALNYATPRSRNRANGLNGAQALVSGAGRIALVHFLRPPQELTDPYYIGVRLGIENRCRALQIDVVKVYHADSLPDATLLREASGVIAIGRHTDEEVEWLREHSRTVVFADFSPQIDLEDSVESNIQLAMRKLLSALRDRGYRRIGFIGWLEHINQVPNHFTERRCRTYIEWMKQHDLFDPELCVTEHLTPDSGYTLAKSLMQIASPPDIIVACNDNMAIGAYRAMLELGLKIPDDVAIASFNDIPVAQLLNPPLSTVRIPAELIGETAVDLLLERFAGRDIVKTVILSTDIIWRESTR